MIPTVGMFVKITRKLLHPTTVLVYADRCSTARKPQRSGNFGSLPLSIAQCIMDVLETQASPTPAPFRPDRQVTKWAFGFIAPIAGDDSISKRFWLENAGFAHIAIRVCRFRWRANCLSTLRKFARRRTDRPKRQWPLRPRRQPSPAPPIPPFHSPPTFRPVNRRRSIQLLSRRMRFGMFVRRLEASMVRLAATSCDAG